MVVSASSNALASLSKEDRAKLYWGTTSGRDHAGKPGLAPSKSQGGMALGEISNMDMTMYRKWRKAPRADRSQITSVSHYDWKVAKDYLANKHFLELNKNRPPGVTNAPNASSPEPKSVYKTLYGKPSTEQIMSATDHAMPLFKNLKAVGLSDYNGGPSMSRAHESFQFHEGKGGPGRQSSLRDSGRICRGEYKKEFMKTEYANVFARSSSAPVGRRKAPAPHAAAMDLEDVFYETRCTFLAPGR